MIDKLFSRRTKAMSPTQWLSGCIARSIERARIETTSAAELSRKSRCISCSIECGLGRAGVASAICSYACEDMDIQIGVLIINGLNMGGMHARYL